MDIAERLGGAVFAVGAGAEATDGDGRDGGSCAGFVAGRLAVVRDSLAGGVARGFTFAADGAGSAFGVAGELAASAGSAFPASTASSKRSSIGAGPTFDAALESDAAARESDD